MNDAENTMRLLADKPLLVKSPWCYIGLHRWTMYSKPQNKSEGVYNLDYQTRQCDNCGLHDIKILRRT